MIFIPNCFHCGLFVFLFFHKKKLGDVCAFESDAAIQPKKEE